MRFQNNALVRVMRGMYDSGEPPLRAHAENLLFEERIGADRQAGYEAFAPARPSRPLWAAAHGTYLERCVYQELPETFQAINQLAALSPAAGTPLGEDQWLVRVESLDYALGHTKAGSIDDLQHMMDVAGGNKKDERVSIAEAQALLTEVCDSLNRNKRARRPRFAAFEAELLSELASHDWPDLLRDRLGLSHFDPAGGPIPVALMRYQVKDVVKRAQKLRAAFPLAVPTVLDDALFDAFHPSPMAAAYGRTLNLAGNPHCTGMASEVLHLRFDYEHNHLWKVGCVTRQHNFVPEHYGEMRQEHLFCLQLNHEAESFGAPPFALEETAGET